MLLVWKNKFSEQVLQQSYCAKTGLQIDGGVYELFEELYKYLVMTREEGTSGN
jgi:hypothetical protein